MPSSPTSYYIQACGTNHDRKEDGRTTYEDFYLVETSLWVYLDDDIKNT
jgi:hypothetical protein